jgi:hypothetical protein
MISLSDKEEIFPLCGGWIFSFIEENMPVFAGGEQ